MGALAPVLKMAAAVTPAGDRGWVPFVGTLGTSSGEGVNVDKALTLSEYWGCIHNISEDIAQLPFKVYRDVSGGREPLRDHPVWKALQNQANPLQSAMTVRETLMQHALSWGNGYAEIIRKPTGEVHLIPCHPSKVTVERTDTKSGEVKYILRRVPTEKKEVMQRNMLHLHGLGDGFTGFSVLRMAAESIGLGLAQQTFSSSFFGNGAWGGLALEHPTKISPEGVKNLRASMDDMHRGADKSFRTMILQEGMTAKPLTMPPEEAQLIESKAFTVTVIARFFRMPPHKIQWLDRATFTNIEHQSIEYVTDTLAPWAKRWEQEVNWKLLNDERDVFAEHSLDARLRGDQTARANWYRTMHTIGYYSTNDIKALENDNGIGPDGDQRFVQRNMVPIDQAGMDVSSTNQGFGAAPPDDDDVDDTEDGTDEAARAVLYKRSFMALFADAVGRVLTKEKKRAEHQEHKGVPCGEWAAAWYDTQGTSLADAVRPHAVSLAELLCGGMFVGYEPLMKALAVYGAGHNARSLQDLSKAHRSHHEWLTQRVAQEALELTELVERVCREV